MKMRKIIFMILVAITMNSIATSCSNDDKNLTALENEQKLALNAESSKEQFVNDLNAAFSNSANSRTTTGTPTLSDSQKRFLQQSAVKMLKDENMCSAEIEQLAKQNDLGVIFVGALYLGIVDANSNMPNGFLENHAYKTRSESSGECYSAEKLQSCIHRCIGETVGAGIITYILNGYINQCLTKMIIKQILSKIAGSILTGGVSITISLTACVLDCMGIINIL